MHGFVRVASAVPIIRVANVNFNMREILRLMEEAEKKEAALLVFPELALTGYTCGDLFHQSVLITAVEEAIEELIKATRSSSLIYVVGAPILQGNNLYNCAVVIQGENILGVVPKSYLANYKEFYEKRWFASGKEIRNETVHIGNQTVPFGVNLLFKSDRYFSFGVEICEDLWNVIPVSSYHAIAGATINLNLSASNELVGKFEYRSDLVVGQSARTLSAYVYSSSGVTESTTDLVFSGHALIAENGVTLSENKRFQRKSDLIVADIDCQRLYQSRLQESSFSENTVHAYQIISLSQITSPSEIERKINPYPFVPGNLAERHRRCREILMIQASALAKRLEHTGSKKTLIGISGGLDSTLALLVIVEAFKLLKRENSDIVTVTMPGFGTSDQTYKNAVALCQLLKTDFREIDITDIARDHLKRIDHEENLHDITFENVQARARTNLLMNLSNKENGLVIGTGDLSEIALGWCTYNGDHISMYSVNCGVPKTLVQYLIQWVADQSEDRISSTLNAIIATPISPELLPTKANGEIHHITEDLIGPYELHDFFLYHTVKYGASPEKIQHLALLAFKGKYDGTTIAKWYDLFIRRFFSNQFKRSCIPDGPKVGTISLSPRGDWRMPSDADSVTWRNSR